MLRPNFSEFSGVTEVFLEIRSLCTILFLTDCCYVSLTACFKFSMAYIGGYKLWK